MIPNAFSASLVLPETLPIPTFGAVSHNEMLCLSEEWRRLSETGGNCVEPFLQPEWFIAFARSLESDRLIHLAVVRSNESLLGVAPFVFCSSFFGNIPARTLRSLSGVHSCRFDLIHGGGEPSHLADSIWSSIREQRNWDVIEALDVPADGAFQFLLQHARRDGFLTGTWPTRKSPYLLLPAHDSDPFQNCPDTFKSIRKRLKRKLRNLSEEGAVAFNVHTTDYHEALSQFFALESSGWKGAKGSSIASSPALVKFYSSIAEEFAQRGRLRMYSLTIDSKPIAMHFGLVMNGCYYTPKVAYDENFSRFSPGQILVRHVIADLTQAGVKKYDFLGPRALWKRVWTDSFREHYNCYIFRPSFKGRCLYTLTIKGGGWARRLKYRFSGDPQEVKP